MSDWTDWGVWVALGIIFGCLALSLIDSKARWLACIAIIIGFTAYGLNQ